jgi:NAD(P)H-dependent flavin oxidoreductase YrpB (nitropropane dioxygenase family)
MSTGADVLAAQALGADLAYLGTRFIATEEANAGADYKQMLIDSRGEDIVYTSLFSGVAGNYLRGSVVASRARSGQAAAGRQDENEFRQRRQHGIEGVAGHLERRAERQRHS